MLLVSNDCFCIELDKDFFKKNLAISVFPVDSEASAVVLYENTEILISDEFHGSQLGYSQTEVVHRIIKILKQDALGEANIHVFFPKDDDKNYVQKIKGKTYNLSGDDIIETEINKSDIYKKEIRKNYYEYNFALPAVREGSIIEYSYEIVSPVEYFLPKWNIQGKYPKLLSEYSVAYPDRFEFVSITHVWSVVKEYPSIKDAEMAPDDFCLVKNDVFSGKYRFSSFWLRKNVPAVPIEPYVITLQNFTENIELKLSGYMTPTGYKPMQNSWEKLNEELLKNDHFGKEVYTSNHFLDDIIDSLSNVDTSRNGKIRVIYNYVRSNFSCLAEHGFFAKNDLHDVFRKKQGTEAELNLLLTAMFVHIDMSAAPLLLNTAGNLSPSPVFPMANRFNYVVCAVSIDSSMLLLDASDKNNTIGILPQNCYNGYSRIIKKDGYGVNLTTDLVKEKTVVVVKISGINDTAANVEISEKKGLVASSNLRKTWAKKENGQRSYLDGQLHNMPTFLTITESKVFNEQNPDTNLVVTFSGTIKFHKENESIFINSTLIKPFTQNPFKATTRKLPVEFPHQVQYQYYMSINLPPDMEPSDLPKPVSVDIENGGMVHKKNYMYSADLHILTVVNSFGITATEYPAASYGSIRNFYQEMIAEENEVIALKIIEKK